MESFALTLNGIDNCNYLASWPCFTSLVRNSSLVVSEDGQHEGRYISIPVFQTETYCYCSYYLCNQSETTSPPNISPGGPTLTLALLVTGLHSVPLLLSC